MIAYVTSIGEPTTDTCIWALERNGFEVKILRDGTSLAQKLKRIYDTDEEFLRVDADIIVNRHITPALLETLVDPDIWWWQFRTYDWFKQDLNHAMAYIKQPALPYLREGIKQFMNDIRPETMVSRIPELHNPRRMATYTNEIMGIHGYGITDIKSVRKLKANRGQSHLYDFELAEKLNQL